MKLASSEQMRKIDKEAMDIYGIPGVVLMENAGLKVYKHIIQENSKTPGSICIINGRGNNGGDGFVAARHLSLANRDVRIWLVGDGGSIKGDALVNYTIASKMGLDIKYIREDTDLNLLAEDIKKSGIVVDGLLGTGVKGEITGLYKEVIDLVNKEAKFIISIDIPSGVDADTGRILGTAVRADKTVTFALPKIGLFTYPGAEYAVEVIVEDISIPSELIGKQDIAVELITFEDIRPLFPERRRNTHKGTYGRAFILGGSKDMMGAPAMCCLSALRCGAGIVELAVPRCIKAMMAPLVMEAIVREFDDEGGTIPLNSIGTILEGINNCTSFAVGPGLSKGRGIFELLAGIIEKSQVPGVIDADGLNLLSENTNLLYKANSPLILTPHPGEMSRLSKKSIQEIQEDRIGSAREFSMKYGVITVLKGANTVIAYMDGRVFLNSTGNPGMAKGGSGDVLTGMICSFLAQGMSPLDAAKAGVYIHGQAGDMAAEEFGEYSMKAGDIIECIPGALGEVLS